MFQENSIETCILSRVKQITSPGWMHETNILKKIICQQDLNSGLIPKHVVFFLLTLVLFSTSTSTTNAPTYCPKRENPFGKFSKNDRGRTTLH